MSDDIGEDFVLVSARKDLDRILGDLQSKSIVVAAVTDDHHQFIFNVRHVTDDMVYVNIIAPTGRAIRAGENIQVLFGLPDGLFLSRTVASAANAEDASFPLGTDVYRMQRRNNFRTLVPAGHPLTFRLTSLKTTSFSKSHVFSLIDISAGGVRLRWPAADLQKPDENDRMSGVLVLPGGKQVELFGLVRTVRTADAFAFQVGIEFQNLTLRDEQSILFACVQIHRENQPLKK